MKKTLFLVIAGALAGCGSSSENAPSAPKLDSSTNIKAYLEGKTLLMQGSNIPTEPNGFNENKYYGASTQCYNKVTITIASDTWNVSSDLGTYTGPLTVGATGTCDRNTVSGTANFTSVTVGIANVQDNGSCFDLTVNYGSFQQEGRGAFSSDGKTLTLELFFAFSSPAGHRCADGAVGSQTVTLNGVAFTGNAQQVYAIQ